MNGEGGKEFIAVFKKCEANLPSDIMTNVDKYERSQMFNPPRESRAKQILTKELETGIEEMDAGVKKLTLRQDEGNLLPS